MLQKLIFQNKFFNKSKKYMVELYNISQVKDKIVEIAMLDSNADNRDNITHFIDDFEKIQYHKKEFFVYKKNVPLVFDSENEPIRFMSENKFMIEIVKTFLAPYKLYKFLESLYKNNQNEILVKRNHHVIIEDDSYLKISLEIVISLFIYFFLLNISFKFAIPLIFCSILTNFRKNFKYLNLQNYKLAEFTYEDEEINYNGIDKLSNMKVTKPSIIKDNFLDFNEKEANE